MMFNIRLKDVLGIYDRSKSINIDICERGILGYRKLKNFNFKLTHRPEDLPEGLKQFKDYTVVGLDIIDGVLDLTCIESREEV